MQRNKFRASIFNTGVKADSALFFTTNMHNKESYLVDLIDLAPLGNLLDFFKRECSEVFTMKKCLFVGCDKEYKHRSMLRKHCRKECTLDKPLNIDGKIKLIGESLSTFSKTL